ncbi:MAG: tRNA (guanosine(37)-N1)-methyltransferase TrmD [Alkaliphilus sp.]|jgi:tRNA (guanine37-N1)-methyltransferase|nr:MAG: tRNA (guanosine(37)-N1)-methyltransferase TrmD [Alkaliphilus sp.]
MVIKILTLFPQMFTGMLSESIIKRAIEDEKIDIDCIQIRDYASNKHKKVDDYPYGGGAGMVMTPQPLFDAHEYALDSLTNIKTEEKNKIRTIYMTPKGRVFNQDMAKELSKESSLIFICGHYEGVDQRVIETLVTDEISIGDYVLTGGEIPAMVVIDATVRLIPGVVSNEESIVDESHSNNLLEYPQYTRPQEFRGMEVPGILLSGHHKNIEEWRRNKSLEITKNRRPDLV